MSEDKLVSVLLFVEDVEDELIIQAVENIEQQTHKNIDLIISSFKEKNSEEIINLCNKKFLNVRWIYSTPGPNFINEALDKAEGVYIFYKTINNVSWYPRHIESHLYEFKKDPKSKWSLSHLENRDVSKANQKYNTLSFRISNPPEVKDICMDEICHYNNLECPWIDCLVDENDGKMFYAGNILKHWNSLNYRGNIPPEITVIQYLEKENKDVDQEELLNRINNSIGAPQKVEQEDETTIDEDGNIVVKRKVQTVVGNVNFDTHNKNILSVIENTENITSIGLKRTMGMGDVILCEPIIKKIKQKFPNAEINFYTNSKNITDYFVSKPDNVIEIESTEILKDFLSTQNDIISYDLDLSYESRNNKSFIDSYAEVINVDFEDEQDKYPQLEYKNKRLIEENYIVLCGDGSGWPGKTWPVSYYEELIQILQERGYKIIETGKHHTDLTPSEYHDCDFDTLINLIYYCDFYIGADNGPMHISRSFNKPAVVLNGAALTYLSNPNRENIYYLQNSTNPNVGVKHRQFFNLNSQKNGITFMPVVESGDDHCGIRDIKVSHVIQAFEKLQDTTFVFNSFGFFNDNNIIGFSYHKKEDFIQRERPYYHPENRYNFYKYLQNKEHHIDNNLIYIIDDIENNYKNKDLRILDVGCNTGLLIDNLYDRGYTNAFGCDINRMMIEEGKSNFSNLKEKLFVCNFSKYIAKEKYDLIIMSDVVSNYSSYNEIIKNAKENLVEDGVLYFSDFIFNKYNNNNEYSRGYIVNIFEKNILINKLKTAGFIVEEYFNNENKVYLRCYND